MKKSDLQNLVRQVLNEYSTGKPEGLVGKILKSVEVDKDQIRFEFEDKSSIVIFSSSPGEEVSYHTINIDSSQRLRKI